MPKPKAKTKTIKARPIKRRSPSKSIVRSAKKAKIIKFTPKARSKALAKRQSKNPIVRFIRKPATKIALGGAIAAAGIFVAIDNYVPPLDQIQESVIQIDACNTKDYNCGTGSGFAAFRDNYIVTNYHVVSGADTIKIKTIKDVEGKATKIVAFNAEKDIAILEWDKTLSPIRIGSSEGAKVGDKVLAIGNPLNETNVVSEGIISSKTSEKGLMTTAAISPGSSGGALILDSNHRVIGVTYLKKTNGESMNYAVKIEDVKDVYDAASRGDAFTIRQNNSSTCHTTLSNIALDAKNLAFAGCKDSSTNVYTTESINLFFDVTNDRNRFEHALNERSDWKTLYDRLSNTTKNILVLSLNNTKSKVFNTNWKYAIWYMNEQYYYACHTIQCSVNRYLYGTYPTANNGPANDSSDFEAM